LVEKEKTITNMFLNQVKQAPYNIAVEYEEKTLTYEQLLENSKKIAKKITVRGTQANDIVLLFLPRGIEMIASMLGVLLAGAAYLPLDPELPDERISFIIEDSKAKQLIVSEQDKDREIFKYFRETDNLIVGEGLSDWEVQAEFEPVPITPNHLAYVIYTSGTTGVPKGVMIEHIGVNGLIRAIKKDLYHYNDNAIRISVLTPFHFDSSVEMIYYALLSGHCLCIAPRDAMTDGIEMLNFLYFKKIILTDSVPTHLELLIRSNQSFEEKMTVRQFVTGGETLYLTTLKKFYARCAANLPEITNSYGPTECCVEATALKLDMEYIEELGFVPIGKALSGYEIYILNENKKEVAHGEKGEIYIVSDCLARGYINDPELTEKRFTMIEVGTSIGIKKKRAYKTGDYGEIMPDGNIKFLGRQDEQVKIRGHRIELNEIEAKMLQYTGIRHAVVKAIKNHIEEYQLCTMFTGESKIDINDLRHYLSEKLPDYMIPQKFVQTDELPYLSNGKIDRKGIQFDLADMEVDSFDESDSTEKKLCCLWAAIIGTSDFNADESFMRIGGNSLNLISFSEKINSALHIDIKTVVFFKYHSIKKLADYIDSI